MRSHPRRIGGDERARILGLLCEDHFADLTPRQVHTALLPAGTYLRLSSSMYRIMRERRAICERGRIASRPRHDKPVLVATYPRSLVQRYKSRVESIVSTSSGR